MYITIYEPEQVVANWATISGFFKNALEYSQNESNITDYIKKIVNEQAQCWVVIDNDVIVGAGLTEVLAYRQHKTLHIIAFSGINFEEQAQVFPIVEKFAKECGCIAIEQWGRKGWAKTLPKYVPGFKEVYTVMRKEL